MHKVTQKWPIPEKGVLKYLTLVVLFDFPLNRWNYTNAQSSRVKLTFNPK